MKVLLKGVQIVCNRSEFNGNIKDVLIEDGIIVAIDDFIDNRDLEIVFSEAHAMVSIGWFDMGARFGDPGYEHKEDIDSGILAAIQGGFTEVACSPDTKPAIQSKEHIRYLQAISESYLVDFHVLASCTDNLEGKVMTEIFDLHNAGAVAFSDGGKTIPNSGLLVRLIQYTSQLNTLLIVHCNDKTIASEGMMNEGKTSVLLGLKGSPALAEELMISKNLALLEYAGGRIHFSKISTKGGVDLIRQAKRKGLNVSCDVAVANLIYDEEVLVSFDTNFKLEPPLRTKEDQIALWKGLADGTIDVVISDHNPQDEESKKMEFDMAEFGMTQLETSFSMLNERYQNNISLCDLVYCFSVAPRQLLNLNVPKIEVGAKANLTIFSTEKEWSYDLATIRTKSKNSPNLGQKMKGKALAVFNKGQFKQIN